MKSWAEKYNRLSWESRMLILLGGISFLPALFSLWTPAPVEATRTEVRLDTHIPRGFVLIPIDVQNYEALDSILGPYGIVDLFKVGPENKAGALVARNVRLLRAPHNPSHFAALVPESEAPRIFDHGGSFVVVVKPLDAAGTKFVTGKPKGRRIIYGGQ